jgi:hypothetical protein
MTFLIEEILFFLEIGHTGYKKIQEFYAEETRQVQYTVVTKCPSEKVRLKQPFSRQKMWLSPIFSVFNFNFSLEAFCH